MNLLNKLTIKNLKLNKKRTIVTIIGIILSVALITAVASIYASGINSLINYETYLQGNFHYEFLNVPTSELATFKNNRKIDIASITENIGYANITGVTNPDKPYAYIKAFDTNALNNLSVKLVEGHLPKNDSEILIPTHLKTNGHVDLKVGDTLTLDIGTRISNDGVILNQSNPYRNSPKDNISESLINTTSKTYKIVGIIERPASNIESYSAPGYTFITYMNNPTKDNVDIYVRYTKDALKKHYETTANILGVDKSLFKKLYEGKLTAEEFNLAEKEMTKAKYQIDNNSYLITLEVNPLGDNSIGGLGAVAIIVCLIIIFTSVFCIKNSFDISITEKIKQYGMLRSIGATKKQIKKNVFFEATILGLIGIPLGIISGIFASFILIIVCNYYLNGMLDSNIILSFTLSYIAIIIAIILGIITVFLSAFRSATKASKISPINSIRNSGNIKIKKNNLKSPKIIHRIFGVGGDISYKNLKRNKKKYRTTVISIIVSVAIFIALSSFMKLAFLSIENEIKLSDYNLDLSAHYNDEIYDALLKTKNLSNINKYAIVRHNTLIIDNIKYGKEYQEFVKPSDTMDSISIYSIGDAAYKDYLKALGLRYEDMKDKGILHDKVTLSETKNNKEKKYQVREYDYNKNDVITSTLENGNALSLTIGATTDKSPFSFNTNMSSYMIVSDEFFDNYITTTIIQAYYDSTNASITQEEIENVLKGQEYSLNNSEENVKAMRNLFTLIGIFLYGFIIVISLIGITNIFNTITTNMNLRKPEFAMLKSVGMTKKEFNRMIRLESIFMGLKSLIFGIPLGLALSYLIYKSLSDNGIDYPVPIKSIIISTIAVFLLITLLMKYSMSKINKQNTIETIRNENI